MNLDERRKAWERSSKLCQACQWYRQDGKGDMCRGHRNALDEIERDQSRAVIARDAARLGPLPKPPPLPPRRP